MVVQWIPNSWISIFKSTKGLFGLSNNSNVTFFALKSLFKWLPNEFKEVMFSRIQQIRCYFAFFNFLNKFSAIIKQRTLEPWIVILVKSDSWVCVIVTLLITFAQIDFEPFLVQNVVWGFETGQAGVCLIGNFNGFRVCNKLCLIFIESAGFKGNFLANFKTFCDLRFNFKGIQALNCRLKLALDFLWAFIGKGDLPFDTL